MQTKKIFSLKIKDKRKKILFSNKVSKSFVWHKLTVNQQINDLERVTILVIYKGLNRIKI